MLAKNLSLISEFDQYSKYQWTSGSLNNLGESITFKDVSGNTIDYVSYSSISPWPVEVSGQDYYLKLIASHLDNTLPESWEAKSLMITGSKMISSKHVDKTEDVALKSIKIYPNPVKDVLFIELNEQAVITIYNISGQKIQTMSLNEGHHSLNVSQWSKGTYLIRVSGQKETTTYKIIKE